VYKYVSSKGEVIVTFNPSFKIFNLVLNFKFLNYQGVKINNFTRISIIKKWSDFKSVYLCILIVFILIAINIIIKVRF
jgi:hypothetical protein